jgi:hypothetical protein
MSGDMHRPGESKRPRQATRRKRTVRALILTGAVAFVAYWAHEQFSPPDVGEPFDVAAFQAYTLSDEQNAFTFYRKAVALFVSEETVFASNATLKRQDYWDSWKAAEQGWEHASPAVRQWVKLNRGAREALEQGAACAESLEFPLSDVTKAEDLSFEWGKLRACARIEFLEGLRLTAEGHPVEAWKCFRDLLRASRHLAMHAGRVQTIFGSALGDEGLKGTVIWSAHKDVTPVQLRQAIRDVLAIEEMRTPASDSIKVEYLGLRDFANKGVVFGTTGPSWVRSTGYPAQIGRAARLVVANLLTQADRPRYLRTAVHPGSLGLFELDPAAAPDPKLRPPQEIEASAVNSAPTIAGLLHKILPDAAQQFDICDPRLLLGTLWEASLWQDVSQMHRSGLALALALQLHYREHDEFPASLDELVKNGYLKSIPADPFGKGEAFHYRRDRAPSRDARLWSVYTDGIDNGGADLHDGKGDWAVHVQAPGTSSASPK